jgi:hypothetical protein
MPPAPEHARCTAAGRWSCHTVVTLMGHTDMQGQYGVALIHCVKGT